MAQLATKIVDQAPAAPAAAIDRGHLARMTFGDRSLEREVLQLFDRQAGLLLARMRDQRTGGGGHARAYAEGLGRRHRRTGVVRRRRSGRAGRQRGRSDVAIGRLATAIDAARAAIAGLLGALEGIASPAE